MKQATITLSLSKDHQIERKNVTPFEAILFVAEHHRNFGGNPVEVHKDTIEDAFTNHGTKEETIKVTGKPDEKKLVPDLRPRTIDEEASRLRQRYHPAKVKAILNDIRDIPMDDFKKACDLGINIILPTKKLAEVDIA